MKIRTAGRVERIGVAALAFAVVFLACNIAMASDDERQIPVIRDAAASGLTIGISGEGTRQTATPVLALHNSTVQGIEDRIVKKIADSRSRIDLAGTPRKDSGRSETTVASLPLVPGEITIRSVKGFLKGLRSSRKEKPAPAVVVPAPELRLGRIDTSPRETN